MAALEQARRTHKGMSVWAEVARLMGDERTDTALQQHWCARAASRTLHHRTAQPYPSHAQAHGPTHAPLSPRPRALRQIMSGRRKRAGGPPLLEGFEPLHKRPALAPDFLPLPIMTHSIRVVDGKAPLVIEDLD